MMKAAITTGLRQKTAIKLSGQQLLSLSLLEKSLPDLRAEVVREIESNPVLEDLDHPLERSMSEVEKDQAQKPDAAPEMPEDDFIPLARRYDEDALERRQAMFDNHTGIETLQQHLTRQIPVSDLDPADRRLAEALIGDLDGDGYYRGSLPDTCMAYDRTEAEVRAVLGEIMTFDPPGCGATNAQECLRAQLGNLADRQVREQVSYLIDHLSELVGSSDLRERYAEAYRALQSLEPHPGRSYLSEKDRIEYINPEVHSVQDDHGHWCAITDQRSLPEIRISQKFLQQAADPTQSEEVRQYLTERIEHARALREAIVDRQSTVENIAQAIFDRQQAFFADGFKALKPMTELEIAEAVGVTGATVSRTVRDKYAETPQGIIELRRFFSTGIKNEAGETISQDTLLLKLREIIAAEDRAHPLSDAKLALAMNAAGYPIARRTVAKYREKLNLPEASRRRRVSAETPA